jgi:DNA-binding transcriptional ArsR family regulator
VSNEAKNIKTAQRAYEAQMVRSAAHPVRAKALSMMAERPSSPKEIAEAVGKPIGNVVYHIQALERAGMALLVDEKKRGGATEHFYVATTISEEESENLTPRERRMLASMTLHRVIADAAVSMEVGKWAARPDSHISRVPLYLDEEGWREIATILSRSLDTVLEAQAQCAERLDREGREGFGGLAAIFMFETGAAPERD